MSDGSSDNAHPQLARLKRRQRLRGVWRWFFRICIAVLLGIPVVVVCAAYWRDYVEQQVIQERVSGNPDRVNGNPGVVVSTHDGSGVDASIRRFLGLHPPVVDLSLSGRQIDDRDLERLDALPDLSWVSF